VLDRGCAIGGEAGELGAGDIEPTTGSGAYRVFDHTADLGVHVEAAGLDDLFRTAAIALVDQVVGNRGAVRGIEREAIEVCADEIGELLALWLTEILFRIEARHRIYGNIDVHVDLDACRAEGVIWGEPMDARRHILEHEVKAITRHGLRVERQGGGWVAEFIIDI
jgi:SHS2 domain-containing protein